MTEAVKKEELTNAQINFLKLCEACGWGVIKVIVKNGQPVMASIVEQEYKLDT